ncbi:MAG: phosphoribosyltransferase family protein [Pseudonocardiaceae bacterium]
MRELDSAAIVLDLTWAELDHHVTVLAEQIRRDGVPQVIVGILRGGMIPAVQLAHQLGVRDVRGIEVTRTLTDEPNGVKADVPQLVNPASLGSLDADADVLVVDDVAGSGDTLDLAADLLTQITARVRRVRARGQHHQLDHQQHRCAAPNPGLHRHNLRRMGPLSLGGSMSTTEELGDGYRTHPDTPMVGVYSANQMDDFYAALAIGEVKATGIMNYLQRLLITDRCRPGDRVVDVCCGRGLQLPVFYRYRPDLASYVGLDISPDNLAEAAHRQAALDKAWPREFSIDFHQCDVADPWPAVGEFDVAIYTSALEHLPRELGVASLRNTAEALAPTGRLYLSTPNTPGSPPRKLQYHVHVYEWSHEELVGVLAEVDLVVDDVVGILPPVTDKVEAEVNRRFGPQAVEFYRHMRHFAPDALLGPVVATGLGEAAIETLYVCSRRPA